MKAGFGTGAAPTSGEPTARVAFKPPPLEELAGLFPQLEIVELLGQGGMGAVYKARQPALDRWIALKVLPPRSAAKPDFPERFNREARALARLSHQNIVAVHDFGKLDGLFYFLMEYVDGVSLRQLLQGAKLTPEEALAIVPKICDALQYAHEHGVVHRDIKPENVLLNKEGQVKIADFGIAKIVEGESPGRPPITQEQQVIGTPHYMAPEQVEKPQQVDHRADIYSLGVVFYEMLTGELPLGKFAPPSRKMQVDVRLDEVVLRALAKEPELRYQHASEVKTAVETIVATASVDGSAVADNTGSTPSQPGHSQTTPPSGPSGRWRFSPLPNLLSGERVLHFQRRVGVTLWKSLPNYRLNVSWPPLSEIGFYVTDRRMIVVTYVLRLVTHEFSIWFPATAPGASSELLKRLSTGQSRWFGSYLELISEHPQACWYRTHELRLRLYLRKPEFLAHTIAAASSQSVSKVSGNPSAGAVRPHDRKAILVGMVGILTLVLLVGLIFSKSLHRQSSNTTASQEDGVLIGVIGRIDLSAAVANSAESRLISLFQPYPAVYPGAPTDRISLQYAVMEVCRQAGVQCDWDRTFQQIGPVRTRWIYPAISNETFASAMDELLSPFAVTCRITDTGSIVLKKE
jgi:serine/threonine protein kinase